MIGALAVSLLCLAWLTAAEARAEAEAREGTGPRAEAEHPVEDPHVRITIWAFITAAAATGLGSVAAGVAVSLVGSSVMGAVAERPELMGRSLVYVALAEGIAIYGLLIAIVILAKV